MRLRACLLAFLSAAPALGQDGGRPGGIFRFGASARGMGLAGAYTASAEDATALYYNPAGLGRLGGRQAAMMHAVLYEGTSLDYAGYGQARGPGAWGVQMMRLKTADLEGRDEDNRLSGSLDYSETALSAGYGAGVLKGGRLSLGGSFKMLSRRLGDHSNQLYGADLGARFLPAWLGERLSFGLTAMNVMAFRRGETSDRLPFLIKGGGAAQMIRGMTLALDVTSGGELELGAEYVILSRLALRAGYQEMGPAFGGGITLLDRWQLDVAVQSHAVLGAAGRFSIGYRFGRPPFGTPRGPAAARSSGPSDPEAALADGDYAQALRLHEKLSMAGAAEAGPPERYRRLRSLLAAMDSGAEGLARLKGSGEQGRLAAEAVRAFMEGEHRRSLVYAAAAAGTDGRERVFARLLRAVESLTSQKAEPEEIAPVLRVLRRKMDLAEAHSAAGRYEDAAEACVEALWLDERYALAHERLGSFYFALGRIDAAIPAWERALELDPGNKRLEGFLEGVRGRRR